MKWLLTNDGPTAEIAPFRYISIFLCLVAHIQFVPTVPKFTSPLFLHDIRPFWAHKVFLVETNTPRAFFFFHNDLDAPLSILAM